MPDTDKNSLTYWFPLIQSAGLPVPKTHTISMPADLQRAVWRLFDNEKDGLPTGREPFFDAIRAAGEAVGYPCFLRSSHTSDKHEWAESCFVKSPDDMVEHVYKIAYFSECADFMGLPWDNWAVRELLPTIPFGVCPRYDGMPVCREFRFFVDDGKVRCWHPYWPMGALKQGGNSFVNYEALCRMDNEAELSAIACAAGAACGGSWSVDLLETERGWFLTDMALAARSYHWEGCEHA